MYEVMRARPSASRQAAALRLAAARAEAGESLSPELKKALVHELEQHPEEAAEVEAFAATEASAPPTWHLEEIERREREEPGGGEGADVVIPRVLRQIRQRRRRTA